MECINCSMQADAHDDYCGYCGSSLQAVLKPKKKRHILLLVFSTVGFFLLALLRIIWGLFTAVSSGMGESTARDRVADLEVKFHTNPSRQVAKDLAKAKEDLATQLARNK